MGPFFKFIFYVIAAYLIIRFLNRLFSPRAVRPNSEEQQRTASGSIDKPKFNIEADTVEYEIIDEEKEKDEK